MQTLVDVPAPAKLNLFLHVCGRRRDGYHLLQSAFMLIDWCDILHFELRRDGRIDREDLGATLPPDDLVVRAAKALQQAARCPLGVHIGIEKRIPSQAGMGGGSSDAASTLLALNRLWDLRLDAVQLQRIGLSLGADVPFFLFGRNAWAEGVGEQLTPLAVAPARFLVLKPPQGLDTAAIFQHPDLHRATKPATISGFAANPWRFGQNDLQPVARSLCPAIAQALEGLQALGLEGRMTGSGSAVFAHLPDDRPFAGIAWPEAPGWQWRVCGNLEAHPLSGWAAGTIQG
ncbi:MAG: 4-(cytidine 5'-diphospho)-2-C-methyl-D-erythritol kinase [Burkholderiaceae bacterium]|jgi:4-diphosphocytidyl-2-C-methyl-D-erythritol kinase|nr:4-(cytidine 5'-diphospho)-2-C-methyl-D-erythritol kinase [Burkholderiaceae bacterium]